MPYTQLLKLLNFILILVSAFLSLRLRLTQAVLLFLGMAEEEQAEHSVKIEDYDGLLDGDTDISFALATFSHGLVPKFRGWRTLSRQDDT